jgi:hypothetical protein
VRATPGLHRPTGEFYWVGLNNRGAVSLQDVVLRAVDCFFTNASIAQAHLMPDQYRRHRHGDIVIYRAKSALHPGAPEIVQLFGLSFSSPVSDPDYILNKVQQFTLEASARDTPACRREFEFNPHSRPMIRMLPLPASIH